MIKVYKTLFLNFEYNLVQELKYEDLIYIYVT